MPALVVITILVLLIALPIEGIVWTVQGVASGDPAAICVAIALVPTAFGIVKLVQGHRRRRAIVLKERQRAMEKLAALREVSAAQRAADQREHHTTKRREVERVSQEQEERLRRAGLRQIDEMSGEQFEKRLALHFTRLGFTVTMTAVTGDFGADLIIQRGEDRRVIQAKRRQSSAVGTDAVQQVVGAIKHYRAQCAMVITNRTFTPNARALAESNAVELWDRTRLTEELARHGVEALAPAVVTMPARVNPASVTTPNLSAECQRLCRGYRDRLINEVFRAVRAPQFGGASVTRTAAGRMMEIGHELLTALNRLEPSSSSYERRAHVQLAKDVVTLIRAAGEARSRADHGATIAALQSATKAVVDAFPTVAPDGALGWPEARAIA